MSSYLSQHLILWLHMVGTACAITPTKIMKWQFPLQSGRPEITFCWEMLLIFLTPTHPAPPPKSE